MDKPQNYKNNNNNNQDQGGWIQFFRDMWRTPLGLLGVTITTICISLMLFALALDFLGLVHNAYFAILSYMVLPAGMVFGLLIIPLGGYMRRRHWFKSSLAAEQLQINLSSPRHRRLLVAFLAISVLNIMILLVIGYEGYHFTDSPYFCGQVCHQVMDPEYTAYQRSAHAKVSCVECHIGPGAQWYVQAKISGLRQVAAVINNDFSRPIPAPVEHLRPARDTCEQCHWPDKFHGKKIKEFISFSNDNQQEPEIQNIALHIGGRNPLTDSFEGIHWHVSSNIKVEYQSLNKKRTQIGRIKVTRAGGITEEYSVDNEDKDGGTVSWRVMDCIDCHNRPTHVYDRLEERVDFGLLSKKIDPEIPGIREDSIAVLKEEYSLREVAREKISETLLNLQAKRHGNAFVVENENRLVQAGGFLLETYLNNVWPDMKVSWGTYKSHMGHQEADDGYGCFRCHDDEHLTGFGKTISQDCDLCHDEPE